MKNFVVLGRLRHGVAPLALGLALSTTSAFAQDIPAEEGAADDVIVVTGSRVARPELAMPNPVQIISAQTIEQTGNVNLTDFLVDNPALLGSMTNIDVAGSNLPNAQLVGVNTLDLRNLGSSRTLVLVDGRRHVAGIPGNAAVDINTIPTDLVERIDVLTGGASAVYGADGVTGVVNFILKKDFEGLRLRAQTSLSQRGDAGDRYVAATFGKNFADGRGNITLAYEFNETDRFSQRQRLNYGKTGPSYAFLRNQQDFPDNPNVPDRVLYTNLTWADSWMGGAIDLDFDGVPDRTGEGGIYDRGQVLVNGGGLAIGGTNTPRETYYGDFTPYTRRHIANVMMRYEFSPALEVYAEGKYVRSSANTFAQPTYDFYTLLAPDNAYLEERFGAGAASPDGALFSRDNFDFGIRQSEMERELWRTVVGARGDLGSNLKYDISYVFGQSTQTATNRNDRYTDRYYAAIDAVYDANGKITCRINLPGQTAIIGDNFGGQPTFNGAPVSFRPGECVPLNILGQGAPTQEALDFVTVDHRERARVRQHVVSASLSGDTGSFFSLPGGPVGFAIGAEYRKESSNSVPSDITQAGLLMDSSQQRIDKGSFDVKEIFGEINLPILKDQPFAELLSIGGAVRLSDYSTIGTTTTWKADGTWAPVRDIMFRATYSQAVRAPNIVELFAGGSGSYEFIIDPCSNDRLAEGKQFRVANCEAALGALGIDINERVDPNDPTSDFVFNPGGDQTSPQNSSLLGFQGGNRDLTEETAKTWTAGVVLRPSFVPGLSITADWYNIRIKKAIQYSTAQDIVDLCYDQPTLDNIYCDVIERDATTGYISDFSIIPANVASFKTSGLDVTLNYAFEPFANGGKFNVRVAGNYLDKLSFVPSLDADPENEMHSASYPAPRYSGTFDLSWTKGAVTLNYGIDWYSKTRRVTREQEAANPDYIEPGYFWYRDKLNQRLYASVNVDDRFDIYGGINNLWDRKPDVGAIGYPMSAEGRSFYVGIKAKIF